MRSWLQKLSVFSIVFFGVFCLFPIERRSLLFILLGAASLLSLIEFKNLKFHKLVFINSILFLSYLVALTYTSDIPAALKRFETGASLLIAPLVFSLFYFNQKGVFSEKVKLLFFKVLHWSNVVFMFIIGVFYIKIKYVDLQEDYGYFLSHLERRLPFLNDHPIYISIIFSVSILFSLHYILSKKTTVKFNWTYGVSSILLLLMILFLSRRGVIMGLIISVLSIIVFSYKNNAKQIVTTTIGVLAVICVLLFLLPQTNKRIGEMLNKTTYTAKNETNSTNNRLQIYKCAIDLIKEKPLFGYGIEDDRTELYQCYKENLYYLFELKFNTHNQYLSILMKVGIIGLLLFLWFLYYNLNLAIQTEDWLFVGVIIFFSIVMLFENILERQNGVMLFTFLINYFAFKNYLVVHESNDFEHINVHSK